MTPETEKRLKEIEGRVELAGGECFYDDPVPSEVHEMIRADIPWLIELARDLEKEELERQTNDAKLFRAAREKIERLEESVAGLEEELKMNALKIVQTRGAKNGED